MTDLHTSVQTFLADCNQLESAKELVTRLMDALRVAEGDAFALAAITCDAPAGDEYGNRYCETVRGLEQRITTLQDALRGLSTWENVDCWCDPHYGPSKGHSPNCAAAIKALAILTDDTNARPAPSGAQQGVSEEVSK